MCCKHIHPNPHSVHAFELPPPSIWMHLSSELWTNLEGPMLRSPVKSSRASQHLSKRLGRCSQALQDFRRALSIEHSRFELVQDHYTRSARLPAKSKEIG